MSNIEILKQTVTAKSRKLRVKWTIDPLEDQDFWDQKPFIDYRKMTVDEIGRYSKRAKYINENMLCELDNSEISMWRTRETYFFIQDETFYLLDHRTTKDSIEKLKNLINDGSTILDAIETIKIWNEL